MRKHRSRRIVKKLHKRFLWDIRYDISLSALWRATLFQAADGAVFPIGQVPSAKLHNSIQKYGLRFCVMRQRIVGTEWVRFIFYPADFPELRIESENPLPGSKAERSDSRTYIELPGNN